MHPPPPPCPRPLNPVNTAAQLPYEGVVCDGKGPNQHRELLQAGPAKKLVGWLKRRRPPNLPNFEVHHFTRNSLTRMPIKHTKVVETPSGFFLSFFLSTHGRFSEKHQIRKIESLNRSNSTKRKTREFQYYYSLTAAIPITFRNSFDSELSPPNRSHLPADYFATCAQVSFYK